RPERPARLAAVVDRPDRFFLFISVHHALADGYGMNPVIATLDTSYKMKDVPLDQLAVPEPANEHTDRSVATYLRIIEDDEAFRADVPHAGPPRQCRPAAGARRSGRAARADRGAGDPADSKAEEASAIPLR